MCWVMVGEVSKQEGLGEPSWGSAVNPLPKAWIFIWMSTELLESY